MNNEVSTALWSSFRVHLDKSLRGNIEKMQDVVSTALWTILRVDLDKSLDYM